MLDRQIYIEQKVADKATLVLIFENKKNAVENILEQREGEK